MINIKTIKGDNLNILVQDIQIILFDDSKYNLNYEDNIIFSMSLNGKDPIIQKTLNNGLTLVNGNILVEISPEETSKLKCLGYDFDIKLDMKNEKTNIYTITNGVIEILPTVTEVKNE